MKFNESQPEAAKIRREINVTQEGFARILGVSLGTVRPPMVLDPEQQAAEWQEAVGAYR